MTVKEARANDELIALADSLMLRWIDELNGVTNADDRARRIKNEINRIKRMPDYPDAKKRLRFLYDELDRVEFKADYVSVVMDSPQDYRRACRGFTINGVRFVRLLGTAGGIKMSTIVFVSDRLAPELRMRIDNGRNQSKLMVPAKFEAYRALTCSGSVPVSMPRGIAVISETEVSFHEKAIRLRDGDDGGEPVMTMDDSAEIRLNICDGCGMMLPSLAERWSRECGLEYTSCGFNTRFAWEKGMVFTFDFLDFADKIAHTYIIRDAWGNDVDLRNVELILSTTMVKLWDSYASFDDYMSNSIANHYTFGLTKSCPEKLDTQRATNYQFLQSFDLDDDDLAELISTTSSELRDVMSEDPMKSILFMKGKYLSERNVQYLPDDYMKAAMIDSRILNDPFVRSRIRQAVKGRIDDAKIGVIDVHGNFSIIAGDLYALCEHMFGMEPHGVLEAGELYSRFWSGTDRVVCFRAPMSCHNNIRTQRVSISAEAAYWFRYITTATVLNIRDSLTHALNGADFDGDLLFTTDNPVLLRNARDLPVIMCEQKTASKKIPSEVDIIESNINGFGDDIGKITNRVTAMFDVQSGFERGSEEWNVLEYRIQSGQLLQQNAIDRIKGIISNPMPKEWYSREAVMRMPTDTPGQARKMALYLRIVADRKPYFQTYIYPDIMRKYKQYMKNTRGNCISRFHMTPDELMTQDDLDEEQEKFLWWYHAKMPTANGDCVTNRLCRMVESTFDRYTAKSSSGEPYDYSVLIKDPDRYKRINPAIEAAYASYGDYLMRLSKKMSGQDSPSVFTFRMMQCFAEEECLLKVPNKDIACDMAIRLYMKHRKFGGFLWDVFGDILIERMLEKSDRRITFPKQDPDGEIIYGGERYTAASITLEEDRNQPDFEREGICGTFDVQQEIWQ